VFIGGLQKFTLIDYPDKIAAVVFTMGCNFRCPYCHNPEIVNPKSIDYDSRINEADILKFLNSRMGNLEGVCITGGEPTLQIGLAEFIRKIKEMGFSVKIDTNGSNFKAIESLTKSSAVDYWAVDIKTAPKKYKILTKRGDIIENMEKSVSLIANSNADLELRTTVAPGIVNLEDFDEIIRWINKINPDIFLSLSRYAIQNFRPRKTLEDEFAKVKPYSGSELEKIAEKIREYCRNVVVME